MRLKNNQLKSYMVYKRVINKDSEGNRIVTYEEKSSVKADIHYISGQLQATMYGERLQYMLEMICNANEDIQESDAISVNGDKPDYKVVTIKHYNFLVIELEKI